MASVVTANSLPSPGPPGPPGPPRRPHREPPQDRPDWAADLEATSTCSTCRKKLPLWQFIGKHRRQRIATCIACRECRATNYRIARATRLQSIPAVPHQRPLAPASPAPALLSPAFLVPAPLYPGYIRGRDGWLPALLPGSPTYFVNGYLPPTAAQQHSHAGQERIGGPGTPSGAPQFRQGRPITAGVHHQRQNLSRARPGEQRSDGNPPVNATVNHE